MGYRQTVAMTALVLTFGTAGLLAGTAFGMGPAAPALRAVEADGGVMPVEASPARYQDGYLTRESFAGMIEARRASALGFETGGRLAEFLVDEGEEIRAGQRLARLDRRQLQARREELAAQLELARLTARRRQPLAEKNHVSQQSFDEARLQAQATAAALKAVEVQLDLAELKAPYDAVVVTRLADEGTVTAPGQAILRILERNAWEARIGLPPERAARLQPGREVTVRAADADHAGTLRTILPQIDRTTRTALALFDIEDPGGRLRAGDLARVQIETRVSERGFWLPVTALSEGRRGLWTAFVIGGGGSQAGAGVAERRQLQVVHTETDRAYVRGAVKEGEYVITAGVHRLVPGQAVSRTDTLSAGGQ